MYYNAFVLFFVWCPCMAINVSVQHNSGFLPGIILLSGERLPKRMVFENLEGAVQRGRGGKEKSGPIAYRATSGRLA